MGGPVDQEESTDTAIDEDGSMDGTPSLPADDDTSMENQDAHSLVAHSWRRFYTYTVTSGSGPRAHHIQSSNPSLLVGSTFRTVGSFGSLSMDESVGDLQLYSAPFLLPGEVIQSMMGHVKHRFDVPPSAQAP